MLTTLSRLIAVVLLARATFELFLPKQISAKKH